MLHHLFTVVRERGRGNQACRGKLLRSGKELAQAALEEAPFAVVADEIERALVARARFRGASEPPRKVGARGMEEVVAVELAAPHQPPSWHRADLLVQHLKDVFPGVGGAEQSRWIGERPTLPDFRPEARIVTRTVVYGPWRYVTPQEIRDGAYIDMNELLGRR